MPFRLLFAEMDFISAYSLASLCLLYLCSHKKDPINWSSYSYCSYKSIRMTFLRKEASHLRVDGIWHPQKTCHIQARCAIQAAYEWSMEPHTLVFRISKICRLAGLKMLPNQSHLLPNQSHNFSELRCIFI